ncbi:MAG: hypothetical protein K0R09_2125 [Clostridiales bacterium]|jgi:aldose 1-epimerase|nr:hypothetical protein [Clostridiales bacterium]
MKALIEKTSSINAQEVSIILLENNNNISVRLMSYGAAILELLMPDRDGKVENIVLTYENIEEYNKCSTYFGMICGRTSGRIGHGQFVLDGRNYALNKNEKGITNLHGGVEGFSFKNWGFETFQNDNEVGVCFSTTSPDMEEGYPGKVQVEVTYTLNNKNELKLEYKGETDKATLLNMTNHSYFNLSGNYKKPITEEELFIDGDRFIELDEDMIGVDVKGVKETPMDFTKPKLIGQDINSSYLKNHSANGYDHPWILNNRDINKPGIILSDKNCGRVLKVYTTYPSVVVYTYNYPKNELLKGGVIGDMHYAICLETQYEPNGINYPGLNDGILKPGEKYNEKTIFKFCIE